MKKTLLKLIALVSALAIAAFLVNREEPAPAPKTLSIDGYASLEDLEAERGRGILDGPADIAYPIDEIIISKGNAYFIESTAEQIKPTCSGTIPAYNTLQSGQDSLS